MDSSQFLPKESDPLLPSFQRKEWTKKEKAKDLVNKLNDLVVQKDKIENKELFRRYFGFQGLIDMQRELYNTKITDRNKDLVKELKVG